MKFIQGETNYAEYIKDRNPNKRYIAKRAIVSHYLSKKERGEEITFADQLHLVSIINVSELTGKLEDIWGISSNVLMNPTCQCRAKLKDCICDECYAAAGVNRWSSLCQALEINHIIFNNFDICEEAWATLPIPSINGEARIESHGDAAGSMAAINYLRIVKTHSYLYFSVMTKSVPFYRIAFHVVGKPVNMDFTISSMFINKVAEVPEDMVEYVDHVFTVYRLAYAKEHKININCGTYIDWEQIDHKCKNCMKCYGSKEFYLNELLKSDVKKHKEKKK